MFVEMKVRGLALDAVSNMPIIILRDEEDKRSLQIWVGIFEANAIALELEKVAPARPMTHDLIKNILETLEARVLKVVVTDLKENTFFAVLHLQLGEIEYTVDSRPSDAIALALRVAAPIYVDEEVARKAKSLEVTKEAEPGKADDPERLREWLQNIKPEDFEKFNKACRTSARADRALHQQLPAVLRRRHDLGRDAATRPRGRRPRGVGLRTAPGRLRRCSGPHRALPLDSRHDLPGVLAGRAVLAPDRSARPRARLRRHPPAPPFSARAGRAPARPPPRAAADLHLSHAIREVRALRPAAAWPRGGGRAPALRA